MTCATLLTTVAVLAAAAGSLHTASAAPILLKSRTIDPALERTDAAAVVARVGQRPDGAHLVLQLSGPADDVSRALLAADGITLLRYLPDDAWIARVAPGGRLEAMPHERVTYAGQLEPYDKVSASLRRPTFPAWAVEPDGRLVLRVRFQPDVSVAQGVRALEPLAVEALEPMAHFPGVLARVAPAALAPLAAIDEVLWIEERLPEAVSENDGVRAAIGSETLTSGPLGLNGTGVGVGMWDTGVVDPAHPDFGNRLTVVESAAVSTHATHVAGTLMGSGSVSEQQGGGDHQWAGVAPEATLFCWNTAGDIIAETESATSPVPPDLYLVNNSWGFPVDGTNCDDYGDYRLLAPEFDAVVRGSAAHPITIVFSAGNERNDGDCPLLDGAYACITPPKAAKNVIVVGATNSDDDSMTDFSSFGPVDDGRLKPDLTAPGCESSGVITSTVPGGTYGTWCGTSMATPAVAGSIALLHQLHTAIHGGAATPPVPAFVKALLVATAEDLGNPGPDYAFGHGRIDVARAADAMLDATQLYFSVAQGQTSSIPFRVPDSRPSLRLVLAWSDPDALPLADPALVNNIDLWLEDPAGVKHRPWILDPDAPSANAVRGIDGRNNVEHLTVDAPSSGSWTLKIQGTNVPEGPQLVVVAGLDLAPPPPVTSLRVGGNTDTSIDLRWTNPSASDFEGTLLVRATSAIAWPSGPRAGTDYSVGENVGAGGVVIFTGPESHAEVPFTDGGLETGETYYYSSYTFDTMRNYSEVEGTVGVAGGAVDVAVTGGIAPLALGVPSPNPSAGETTIRFSLPEATVASLRVFDALGRHVRTLQHGRLDAASYETRWTGLDAAGREVAPGVYYVVLETAGTRGRRLTERVIRVD